MNYAMMCHRCGSSHTKAPLSEFDWDEIECADCGEFLDTVGNWEASHSPSLAFQALSMSRTLSMQMTREAQAHANKGAPGRAAL
ncbi:hypothetical protein [Larsenimonas salina]|uniref:hypothetical protein n=1 Tax=Larsenimonas salina TaxID=1295565 RepID=UPI0020732C45|nr:hypothetical protein [Larsenimonas salina]MCM5703863.1 hypothetical protein [Larsenimonas salina]